MLETRLTFLGCGDAFSSGGRLNTCFLVQTPSTPFLIDFGATSLAAVKRAGVDVSSVPLIFITHLHGDHMGGLPFLLLEASLVRGRTEPLTIAGPPGLRTHLPKLIETLFPGTELKLTFELNVLELPPDVTSTVHGVRVTPHLVEHTPTIVCTGLRFEFDGKVLAYSGDTVWTDALPKLAHNADLFICDAYTFDQKTAQHLDYKTLLEKRAQLHCQRLMLTHLGQAFLDKLEHEALQIDVAHDGLEVSF